MKKKDYKFKTYWFSTKNTDVYVTDKFKPPILSHINKYGWKTYSDGTCKKNKFRVFIERLDYKIRVNTNSGHLRLMLFNHVYWPLFGCLIPKTFKVACKKGGLYLIRYILYHIGITKLVTLLRGEKMCYCSHDKDYFYILGM